MDLVSCVGWYNVYNFDDEKEGCKVGYFREEDNVVIKLFYNELVYYVVSYFVGSNIYIKVKGFGNR